MTVDAHEVEWQFDALDLRPVLRWLANPGAWDGRPRRRLWSRTATA